MRKWWNRPRFDLVELCAVGVFVGLAGAFVGWPVPQSRTYTDYTTQQETDRLRLAYGPARYSENEEEWIIRDFFKDRRGGYFVDIGASHYKTNSNTFYLEDRLGWSGVAVDPQTVFEADYKKHRPRTQFFPLFVSDVSEKTAVLYVADRNSLGASSSRRFTEGFGGTIAEVRVPTIALTDLLDRVRVGRIDLLSIDVELSEPKVLAGFDIRRFKPALVCIEAHADVREQILEYFARAGYVALGRYLRVDRHNLYFAPLD